MPCKVRTPRLLGKPCSFYAFFFNPDQLASDEQQADKNKGGQKNVADTLKTWQCAWPSGFPWMPLGLSPLKNNSQEQSGTGMNSHE